MVMMMVVMVEVQVVEATAMDVVAIAVIAAVHLLIYDDRRYLDRAAAATAAAAAAAAAAAVTTDVAIGDAVGDAGKAQGLGPGSLRLRFSTSFKLARGRPADTGSQHSKVDIDGDIGIRS